MQRITSTKMPTVAVRGIHGETHLSKLLSTPIFQVYICFQYNQDVEEGKHPKQFRYSDEKKTRCIFQSIRTYAHLNNISICILARIYTCWLTFVDASLGWAYWVRAATRSTISLIVNAKLQIDGATSTSTLSNTVLLFNTVSVPTLFYTEEKWWQNVRLSSALFGE